jgi:hypothetical protein
MATGDPGARRVRHTLVPDATARRTAASRVATIGLVTAVAVSAAGGGSVTWLCVPAALLAAAECRTRLGSAIGAAVVIVLSAAPVLLWDAT